MGPGAWGVCRTFTGRAAACALGIGLLAGAPPSLATQIVCTSGVAVEGRVLLGVNVTKRGALPPLGRRVEVIGFGCEDDDERDTAMSVQGIPPAAAVVDESRSTLYVERGSLLGTSSHPLHAAVAQGRPRRGRGCRTLQQIAPGVVAAGEPSFGPVDIKAGGSLVATDVDTEIVNRPAYAPLVPGQRLRLELARCARGPDSNPDYREVHLVARRLWFVGPEPEIEPYDPDFGPPLGISWDSLVLPLGILAFAAVVTVVAVRQAPRRDG